MTIFNVCIDFNEELAEIATREIENVYYVLFSEIPNPKFICFDISGNFLDHKDVEQKIYDFLDSKNIPFKQIDAKPITGRRAYFST